MLARGHAQTCVELPVPTRAQITVCTPDGAPWAAHKLCEVVHRDRRLPAPTEIRAQQLKQTARELRGKGGLVRALVRLQAGQGGALN